MYNFTKDNAMEPITGFVGTDKDYKGLTKREYFAGIAMQSILLDGKNRNIESIAAISVQASDALLDALSK